MRYIYQGVAKDGNGKVVPSATVSTYLAGTTTAADVYVAESGGAAVNSVTCGTDGHFLFWVDSTEYTLLQRFKIIISKTNFINKAFDNLYILPDDVDADNYYPTAGATDQGVTGDSNTIKYYIDTIGSDQATIVLRHNSGSATTYTLSTSETIPPGVTLEVKPGAIIAIATGVTLTISGNLNVIPDQYVFNCVGTGKVAGLSTVYSSWFGTTGDGSTDDTTAMQQAFNTLYTLAAAGSYNGVVLKVPAGIYNISDELLINDLITGGRIQGLGFVRFVWTGSTDTAKAVVRITASSGKNIDHLVWDSVDVNAASKAGYCMLAEGTAGGTYSVKASTFRNSTWEGATVANFLGGDITEPYAIDLDFSFNKFDHMVFYNSLYNVKINAANAYTNPFIHCTFGSNVTASTKQHIRLIYGANTVVTHSEFTRLTHPTEFAVDGVDSCAAVYVANRGGISIKDTYSEESRILKTAGISSNYSDVTLSDITINDTRTTAGAITLDRTYFAYNTNATLKISNCHPGTATSYRRIYSGGKLNLSDVNLGARGSVEFSNILIRNQSVIDGLRPGGYQALNRNWDFSRWQAASGSDDLVYDFAAYKGSGAGTVSKSTENSIFGFRTFHIDCTSATSTFAFGASVYFNNRSAQRVTMILSGKLASSDILPSIVFDGGVDGGTNVIANDDNTFIAWATAEVVSTSNDVHLVRFGVKAGTTGEMWIDTAVLVPGCITNGMHSAVVNALPDPINPAIHRGSAAPSIVDSWSVGDQIHSNDPASTGFLGWICTVAGSPGTWKTFGVVTP